jgi:hypothetical protein
MTGSIPTLPSSPAFGERDDVDGLETWEDPIPRRSQFTVQDLCDAFVAASKAQFSRRPKQPSREERAKRIEERQRNILLTALKKYAKQNNIQVPYACMYMWCWLASHVVGIFSCFHGPHILQPFDACIHLIRFG